MNVYCVELLAVMMFIVHRFDFLYKELIVREEKQESDGKKSLKEMKKIRRKRVKMVSETAEQRIDRGGNRNCWTVRLHVFKQNDSRSIVY